MGEKKESEFIKYIRKEKSEVPADLSPMVVQIRDNLRSLACMVIDDLYNGDASEKFKRFVEEYNIDEFKTNIVRVGNELYLKGFLNSLSQITKQFIEKSLEEDTAENSKGE